MFCLIVQNSTIQQNASQFLEQLFGSINSNQQLREHLQNNGVLFKGLQQDQAEILVQFFESQQQKIETDFDRSRLIVLPASDSEDSEVSLESSIKAAFNSPECSFLFEQDKELYIPTPSWDTANAIQQEEQFQELSTRLDINIGVKDFFFSLQTYQVNGYIFFDNGIPASKLNIRLIYHGLRGFNNILAATTVKEDGSYIFKYTPDTPQVNVNVVAVWVDKATRENSIEVPLCRPVLNIGPELELNLVAPTKTAEDENGQEIEVPVQPLKPEFKELKADLLQQVSRIEDLAETQETLERPDLSLLHQATGWDARLIGLTVKAYQNIQTVNLLPDEEQDAGVEILYALYRNGLPFDTEKLALIEPNVVDAALEKAQTAGITQLNDAQLETAKQNFQQFANNIRLNLKAPGTVSTVGQLLEQANLTKDERQKFADVYFAPRQESSDFWQQVKAKGISEDKIATLELQGKLAYLTFNNAELTASLQTEISSSDNLPTLIEKGFHKPETWIDRIQILAAGNETKLSQLIPSKYTDENLQDRLRAYAEDEARQVSLSFPTQLLQYKLNTREIPIVTLSSAFSPEELLKAVSNFLQKAATLGYELGRTPFDPFLDSPSQPDQSQGQQEDVKINRAILEETLKLSDEKFEKVLDRVRQYHTLYQLTPTEEAFNALVKEGFTSAHDVLEYTRPQFLDRLKNADITPVEAEITYRKAQQISAITKNLVTLGLRIK
ncbi:MAG: hypothetical protein AAF921_10575 [Cyanobacteria bacterium P01_D01_bin.44]